MRRTTDYNQRVLEKQCSVNWKLLKKFDLPFEMVKTWTSRIRRKLWGHLMQLIYFADDDLRPRKVEWIPQGDMDEPRKGLDQRKASGSCVVLFPPTLLTSLLRILIPCTLNIPRTPVCEARSLFFSLIPTPGCFFKTWDINYVQRL